MTESTYDPYMENAINLELARMLYERDRSAPDPRDRQEAAGLLRVALILVALQSPRTREEALAKLIDAQHAHAATPPMVEELDEAVFASLRRAEMALRCGDRRAAGFIRTASFVADLAGCDDLTQLPLWALEDGFCRPRAAA